MAKKKAKEKKSVADPAVVLPEGARRARPGETRWDTAAVEE